MKKVKILSIALLSLGLFFLSALPALTVEVDELMSMPEMHKFLGTVEGTDASFEITDSEYLNISLQSSKEITVVLESVPKTISLFIEASELVGSTTLTMSNLEPKKTYYKYEDSYKNEVKFIADENGKSIWTQDLTQLHHIWIQPSKGTVFLPEDCSVYGVWDETTSTCTLAQDLTESIEIIVNGTTLDCNGHHITGTNTGYGIYLNRKSGIEIKNCSVSSFSNGTYLFISSNNDLNNNIVSSNYYGIYVHVSDNNILANNTALNNNSHGIIISSSRNNTLNSNISYNNGTGITIFGHDNNTFTNNEMFNNERNFYLSGNRDLEFNNNIDTSNTVEGKPIYYIKNATDQVYDASTNAGTFYCIFCNNVTIKDLTLTKNGWGVFFWKSHNSKIENVSVLGSYVGIAAFYSNNNTINNNTVNSNKHTGMFSFNSSDNTFSDNTINLNTKNGILLKLSDSNTLIGNSIDSNPSKGIYLEEANGNTIDRNTISDNRHGAELHYATNNVFVNNSILNNLEGFYLWHPSVTDNQVYHNNFINNTVQAHAYNVGPNNLFDNSYPDGGNYWSNYIGVDLYSGPNQDQPESDEIGDTPYIFTGGQDNYPFMAESGWEEPVNQPPTFSDADQYKSDEETYIFEGGITTESIVVFKAIVSDPDNDTVKLQVQIKEVDHEWQDIIESYLVNSGSEAVVTKFGLVEGQYFWRVRTVDENDGRSNWQEFENEGWIDFEVKLVPLYTQVESSYPSWEETRTWFGDSYASGNYPDCWDNVLNYSSIRSCGCAITSMVMLSRYYDVIEGLDKSDVNPANINTWLKTHRGYKHNGDLKWEKSVIYLGFIDWETGDILLRFDFNHLADHNVPFGNSRIDDYVNSSKPVVAYSGRFGHYFIIDNKIKVGPNYYTYIIKDPYWYGTGRLNQTQDFSDPNNPIQGYNNRFSVANLFKYLETPKQIPSTINFHLCSPAELLVTDPLGRKSGKDPIADITYDEIPDSIYTEEGPIISSDIPLDPEDMEKSKFLHISSPLDGEYDIKIIGIDSGSYAIDLSVYDEAGESEDITIEGNIATGNIQEFELDYSTEIIEEVEFYRTVEIDIKPGSDSNTINLKSKGVTPVVVLSDEFFNAEDVVIESVLFAETSPKKGKLEDIDNDGDLDLMLHFETQNLQLTLEDIEATLTGQLTDSALIKGTDSVKVILPGKSKKQSQASIGLISLCLIGAGFLIYKKKSRFPGNIIERIKRIRIKK